MITNDTCRSTISNPILKTGAPPVAPTNPSVAPAPGGDTLVLSHRGKPTGDGVQAPADTTANLDAIRNLDRRIDEMKSGLYEPHDEFVEHYCSELRALYARRADLKARIVSLTNERDRLAATLGPMKTTPN